MDRLRAGLTGLGAVFLLTVAASLAFGHSGKLDAPTETAKEPGEPLAQLGVAPGAEKAAPVPEITPYADLVPHPDTPATSPLNPPDQPDSPIALAPLGPLSAGPQVANAV